MDNTNDETFLLNSHEEQIREDDDKEYFIGDAAEKKYLKKIIAP